MKNIEKKLRQGWNLQDFLKAFDCTTREELFKILRKFFMQKHLGKILFVFAKKEVNKPV